MTMSAPAGAGRLEQTERHRLGDRHDQQRAGGVSLFRQSGDIFDAAKEVWRLHNYGRSLVVQMRDALSGTWPDAGSKSTCWSSMPACCT